jgi:hypothetical protein
VTIIDYFPLEQRAHLTSDVLVLPGTTLTDDRFNNGGALVTIRDVDQTFDANGSHVEAWCSVNPVSRFQEAFTIACRKAVDSAHLKVYQYRFVQAAGTSDLALQAITPGAPDLNPIHQWAGLSGLNTKFAPSTVILVGFTGDTPPQPYIASFSPLATPLEIDFKASTKASIDAPEVDIGASGQVNLGGGATALVPAPWADALKIALTALAGSLTTGTLVSMAAGGTALTTALTALPPDATTNTKAT